MKLLIITQAVDKRNPVLGFFHGWIEEIAKHFSFVTVICLEKGKFDLPNNVRVLSLGKEANSMEYSVLSRRYRVYRKIKYAFNFYKFIWQERKNYDAVFVHMNQEYVILGWKLWLILSKRIYMWRNHHEGNLITDLASLFCRRIFCTSKYSYTAKFKKTVLMPIGVDSAIFHTISHMERVPNSILFLGRMAPVKRPDLLIEVLRDLEDSGVAFSATLIGDPKDEDINYYESLKSSVNVSNISSRVKFEKAIQHDQTVEAYNKHQIFVNLSSSGMYDKTIIEAMMCGAIVLVSNKNLVGEISDKCIFEEGNRSELKEKLATLLALSEVEVESLRLELKNFALKHSLHLLGNRLSQVINND